MKLFFTLFIFLLIKLSVIAQAGFPDKSFGDNGIMIDKNFPGYNLHIVLQRDGKYIVSINKGKEFSIIRYNKIGIIDSSFGNNGVVTPDFNSDFSSCSEITVQTDNKILACGSLSRNNPTISNIIMARYINDGSPDLSFGKDGLVEFSIEAGISAYTVDFAIQPDEKIVITGLCNKGINKSYIPFISRFDKNGNIDKTFGTGGTVFNYYDNLPMQLSSVVIRKDGEIIVGGTYSYLTNPKFMLTAYLSNGNLDSAYGNNGVALYGFGDQVYPELNSIALQEDEKIVCGGFVRDLQQSPLILSQMGVVRFKRDGSVDSTFSDEGSLIFTLEGGGSAIQTILLQKDGKIIGAGNINESTDSSQFAMVRLMPDGHVDSSFGLEGLSISSIKDASYCDDALLDNDNKIILCGSAYINADDINYLTLARYNNDPLSKKQILIAKIRRWLQHHNGIAWDNMPNIKNYAVQHSNNGMNWNTIFSSRSYANQPRSTANNYADPSPLPGTNYYRLETTSVDGAIAYSNVIAIGDENSSISLSPNPAKNVLQVSGLSSSENTKIMVVDLSGNLAISPKLITNSTSHNLNIVTLKPGNYMLRIESNGAVVTKQFVKE